MITPIYEQLANLHPNIRCYKLDIDHVPEVAQDLNVRAVPTFVLYKNGQKVGELQGADAKALRVAIEKLTTE
jgi:thioredoxin 1